MSMLKIIISSTRPGSSGPAIAKWVADNAGRAGTFDQVAILDLAQIDLPFLDEPEHPKLGRYTKPHTLAWSQDIDSADVLVMVTPEYNAGFPAPLKNALDFLHAEWQNKALGMVTYSGAPSGGVRAARMLEPVTRTLGVVTAANAVAIGGAATQVVDGEFVPTGTDDAAVTAMLGDLAELEAGLAPRRAELAMAG